MTPATVAAVAAVGALVGWLPLRFRTAIHRARLQSRLNGLFLRTCDALFFIDDQGRLTDVNPAAAVLTGRRREDLLRLPIWSVIARPSFSAADWRGPLPEGLGTHEGNGPQKDGPPVDVELHMVANVSPHAHLATARALGPPKGSHAARC